MKTNLVFSSAVHILLFATLLFLRPRTRKFEGYPTIIPVELVQIKPISFKAPEVKKIAPKTEKPKPKPKELEGVTVEKQKLEEKPEEQPPHQPQDPEPSNEGESTVNSDNVRLDIKNFPYSYYLAMIQSRIISNWEPPIGPAQQLTRKAVVYFRVHRNGQITDIALVQTSDNFLFDRAAIRAVTLANPLSPLPFDFPKRYAEGEFEFGQGR